MSVIAAMADTRLDETAKGLEMLSNYIDENHDLAVARSSSSRADPGQRVAFKCLNV